MGDDIRAKLAALITDSSMFHAGQQDERLRLCRLIDIRLEELGKLVNLPFTIAARRQELLIIRQALRDHP
jgi:hypothetical protein